jgi:hypothetical protein
MGVQIGPLHVRRSALIHATPARVWQEFASFDRLAAWFGRGHQLEEYQPELGGQVRLSVEIEGVRRPFGGPILAFEPARELFHHGFERLGRDAGAQLQGYEAGWTSHHLEALKATVED